MNLDNLIIIEGGSLEIVEIVLREWIDRYLDALEDGLVFQIYNHEDGRIMIQADSKLENDLFFYLINYFFYPQITQNSLDAIGYTKGKNDDILYDKDLIVFVDPEDDEDINVNITTSENRTFLKDFGSELNELEISKIYLIPSISDFKICKTITVKNENFNENELYGFKKEKDEYTLDFNDRYKKNPFFKFFLELFDQFIFSNYWFNKEMGIIFNNKFQVLSFTTFVLTFHFLLILKILNYSNIFLLYITFLLLIFYFLNKHFKGVNFDYVLEDRQVYYEDKPKEKIRIRYYLILYILLFFICIFYTF